MTDYLTTIETLYRLDLDHEEWLTEVAASARPWLDAGRGVMAWPYDATADPVFGAAVIVGGPEEYLRIPHLPEPDGRRSLMQDVCQTASERFPMESLQAKHPPEAPDFLALIGTSPDGVGVLLGAPLPECRSVSSAHRAKLGCVAVHLAAAGRLRRGIGAVLSKPADTERSEAVLEPDGRCVHAEGMARSDRAREWLRAAARGIDRARGPLRRDDPDEAVGLWQGLVSGRWSLVDQFDRDGRRFVVALRNGPHVRDPRALTLRQRQVVAYAALGRSNKLIAYELGLAESTIAKHMRQSMRKLGARNRVDLVRMLSPAPPGATKQPSEQRAS